MKRRLLFAALAAVQFLCVAPALPTEAAHGAPPPIRIKAGSDRAAVEAARALDAYQAGDLPLAGATYQAILGQEPRNRAALLGMATIAQRQQRWSVAENYYRLAIEADPQDAWAQAGLLNLKAMAEPQAAESRLKSLAHSRPGVFLPHFALGNLYAALGRWNEAQRAYQRAVGADPDNPDALFNLAVGLDHLRQPGLAADYYRQALAAAERRPSAVSSAAISQRLAALASGGAR